MSEQKDEQTPERAATPDPIDDAAQDWFLLLNCGQASAEDRARFEVWRAADPRHRQVYDELAALWADIGDLHDTFVSTRQPLPRHQSRISAARLVAGQNPAPSAPGPASSFSRRQALFGGLALACVALLIVAAPQLITRLEADHITGVGEQAQIALPDGSIAWLNTDTAIAVKYTQASRNISLLRGEAGFEVAQDPERPFAVLARRGKSTVPGTVFAVRDDGAGALVTVIEGAVEVAAPTGGNAQTAALTAGQQVRYAQGAPPGQVRPVDAVAAVAWRDGFINIRNLPLPDAFAEIDRYRRGRIILLADTDSLQPVTARLSIAAIDDGLRSLAVTHGLSITRITEYLVIVR